MLAFSAMYTHAAYAREDFTGWLDNLKQEAIAAGISEKTVSATIHHVALLPNILKLDKAQPEFISPFFEYYQKRVDAQKIMQGRKMLAQHSALLDKVEAQYGVPKAILVAFWGMETNYGQNQGQIDTLSALATLAYDGRRASFFRNQLLDAMRMIDAGHADATQFVGSWAGAFGNMQFMPTTFMTYAMDGDGDKKIDIVNSLADALASAANYLSQVGWKKGEPAAVEVQLPADFEWQNAQYHLKKPVAEWQKLGVSPVLASNNEVEKGLQQVRSSSKKAKAKKHQPHVRQINYVVSPPSDKPTQLAAEASVAALPNVAGQAAVILPQGWRGPAFMVFDNFDAVMDWNRSVNYALSVAQLARRINGEPPILGGQFAEVGALSFQQMITLQTALNAHGFDAGEPDGFPGLRTQDAVRAFQISQHLPADGYASPNILNYLKATPALNP